MSCGRLLRRTSENSLELQILGEVLVVEDTRGGSLCVQVNGCIVKVVDRYGHRYSRQGNIHVKGFGAQGLRSARQQTMPFTTKLQKDFSPSHIRNKVPFPID